MNVFSNSIALVKSSWSVLRANKELVALPAISVVAVVVLAGPFFGLAATSWAGPDDSAMQPLALVLAFVGYLVAAYVAIFFQAALILAANEHMDGGAPTLGSAVGAAWQNKGRILPWAIVSATVSIVLNMIQERAGFIGRLVVGMIGVAWTLVTLLVLPVLVIEQVGITEAFKRSGTAFKQTWGTTVIGNGGVGLVGFLAAALGAVVLGPVIYLGASGDMAVLAVGAGVLLALWFAAVAMFTSALSGVFRTALYRYAVVGQSPQGFSDAQIAGAFRQKGSKASSLV